MPPRNKPGKVWNDIFDVPYEAFDESVLPDRGKIKMLKITSFPLRKWQ
jgi:hypothetical protein